MDTKLNHKQHPSLFALEQLPKRRAELLAARGCCNAYNHADQEHCARHLEPAPRTGGDERAFRGLRQSDAQRILRLREEARCLPGSAASAAEGVAAFAARAEKCDRDARCFFTEGGTKVLAKTVRHGGKWSGVNVQHKTGLSEEFRVAEVTGLVVGMDNLLS